MTPEDLVEIERIRQLKARYFRLLDQKKWDEWAQVFCEDVTIDTTQDGAPVLNGRAAFREFLPPILQNVKTVHHGHTSEIERIGPDTARGVWAMEDMLWWPEADGGRHRWGTGWYEEEYRRDPDGEWRILKLVLRRVRVEMDGQQIFPPPGG
ncbi:MAG: nuclear transport factor 2 family protein [Candidatus Binatia bacterium]|nr:nuclear transport factor 2 family protein [Candidatus Binatia bacterium]